jgi:hypothetical protein
VQTYKKVLFFLLITCFTGFNQGCQKKIYPTNYPIKPGFFPIVQPFKEYRLDRNYRYDKSLLSKTDKKKRRLDRRNKQIVLKEQEKGRKEHLKKQSPEVQERMKKSFEESEKTRGRKTLWERLKSWLKNEVLQQKKH